MNQKDTVVFSGFMMKLGASKIFKAKWKRRFFVLSKPASSLLGQYLLSYYTDRSCRWRKGQIDLKQCEQITESPESGQFKNILSITTFHKHKKRTYFLATETEEDLMTWVRHLCTVCGLKQVHKPENIPRPQPIETSHRVAVGNPPQAGGTMPSPVQTRRVAVRNPPQAGRTMPSPVRSRRVAVRNPPQADRTTPSPVQTRRVAVKNPPQAGRTMPSPVRSRRVAVRNPPQADRTMPSPVQTQPSFSERSLQGSLPSRSDNCPQLRLTESHTGGSERRRESCSSIPEYPAPSPPAGKDAPGNLSVISDGLYKVPPTYRRSPSQLDQESHKYDTPPNQKAAKNLSVISDDYPQSNYDFPKSRDSMAGCVYKVPPTYRRSPSQLGQESHKNDRPLNQKAARNLSVISDDNPQSNYDFPKSRDSMAGCVYKVPPTYRRSPSQLGHESHKNDKPPNQKAARNLSVISDDYPQSNYDFPKSPDSMADGLYKVPPTYNRSPSQLGHESHKYDTPQNQKGARNLSVISDDYPQSNYDFPKSRDLMAGCVYKVPPTYRRTPSQLGQESHKNDTPLNQKPARNLSVISDDYPQSNYDFPKLKDLMEDSLYKVSPTYRRTPSQLGQESHKNDTPLNQKPARNLSVISDDYPQSNYDFPKLRDLMEDSLYKVSPTYRRTPSQLGQECHKYDTPPNQKAARNLSQISDDYPHSHYDFPKLRDLMEDSFYKVSPTYRRTPSQLGQECHKYDTPPNQKAARNLSVISDDYPHSHYDFLKSRDAMAGCVYKVPSTYRRSPSLLGQEGHKYDTLTNRKAASPRSSRSESQAGDSAYSSDPMYPPPPRRYSPTHGHRRSSDLYDTPPPPCKIFTGAPQRPPKPALTKSAGQNQVPLNDKVPTYHWCESRDDTYDVPPSAVETVKTVFMPPPPPPCPGGTTQSPRRDLPCSGR